MKPIRVFNRTLHKELWNWLANNPGKNKHKWPGWEHFTEEELEIIDRDSYCFACLCCSTIHVKCSYGNNCPLDWKTTRTCTVDVSYYRRWLVESLIYNNDNLTKEYAKKVADLPLKENDKFITIII